MTAIALRVERRGTVVLLLGIGALASAIAAGVFLATYEGVGLVGYRTAAAAVVSLVLLLATLAATVGRLRRDGLPRRAVLGLTMALMAYPVVWGLMMAMYVITGALGIYW